jgi:hypothetical protein
MCDLYIVHSHIVARAVNITHVTGGYLESACCGTDWYFIMTASLFRCPQFQNKLLQNVVYEMSGKYWRLHKIKNNRRIILNCTSLFVYGL